MREWRHDHRYRQRHGRNRGGNGGPGGGQRGCPDCLRHVQGPGQGDRDPGSGLAAQKRREKRRVPAIARPGAEEKLIMAANVKVLLVDDNPMVLGMLRQGLASAASIITASDGADALLKIVEEPFDLIVSDYQMTGMNGRQLMEKVK